MSTVYLGSSDSGEILEVGTGLTQAGDDYQLDVTTWDLIPAGEVGDVLFRTIDVAFVAEAGYALGITPIVDGVELAEQTFSGSDTGECQAQAFLATRGTRCAARVRTLSLSGAITLHTIKCSHVTLRATP